MLSCWWWYSDQWVNCFVSFLNHSQPNKRMKMRERTKHKEPLFFCLVWILSSHWWWNVRANLSEQYFTNRQDRYMWINNSPSLADFYHKLILTIGSFSFSLNRNGQLRLHSFNNNEIVPDPTIDPENFKLFGLCSMTLSISHYFSLLCLAHCSKFDLLFPFSTSKNARLFIKLQTRSNE